MLRTSKLGLLLRIALIPIAVYMVFLLFSVRHQIETTQAEISSLTEQVADQSQTNTQLSNAIENRDDPSFLKDIARERLDLVTPNDRVFYITD